MACKEYGAISGLDGGRSITALGWSWSDAAWCDDGGRECVHRCRWWRWWWYGCFGCGRAALASAAINDIVAVCKLVLRVSTLEATSPWIDQPACARAWCCIKRFVGSDRAAVSAFGAAVARASHGPSACCSPSAPRRSGERCRWWPRRSRRVAVCSGRCGRE